MYYAMQPPRYREGGVDRLLAEQAEGVYADGRVSVHIWRTHIGEGRETLTARWRNCSPGTVSIQPEIRLQTCFKADHYVIPAVSLDGNHWGRGSEPKGLEDGGEPWVFDYRRTAIPACTVSEDADHFVAMMASDRTAASLEASCSMIRLPDGQMIHRLLYPCIERPRTYCARDQYREAHEGFITLKQGEVFEATAYILTGKPRLPCFAMADVEDAALDLLGTPFAPRYTMAETADLCSQFAQRLLVQCNGRSMFSIGQTPNGQGRFENREGHELGWCGQNGLYACLFLDRGLSARDAAWIDIAVRNLDAWSHEGVGKSGLIHTHYHWLVSGHTNVEDTCNQGFAIYMLSQAWMLARRHGLRHDAWLNAAKSAADFLVAHYAPDFGFGKAWDTETGECVDTQGTIGAYVIPGLISLWQACREERYLEAARVACRFYRDRDLSVFRCTAGALDTYCIDKEPSGPLLAGSLMLYEADHAEEWLACAEMAGWYFCAWMFHHDTRPRPGSDFETYQYRTLGGTSVSAQHHHIDPWGALVVPQMIQLWKLTGDARWRKRAALLWANAIQNIAPAEGKRIHGLLREAGAQNEGYHHCNWGESDAPGYINEWLVAWPQAFCWNTAMQVTDDEIRV